MRILHQIVRKTWALARRWKLGVGGRLNAVVAGLRRATVHVFFCVWPPLWWMVARANTILPVEGWLRNAFTNIVFDRPWKRWYRSIYMPENRDRFFEYILTFFYKYPIQKGDVVVQIGASFGEETARFARSVGRRGRVIAVEPEAGNQRSLYATFTPDRFPQVTIVPKAASYRSGELRFLVGGRREHRLADLPGENLTYDFWGIADDLDESRYKHSTTVSADTLDNILAELSIDRVDFVLVETNGSELEVVEGMIESLPRIKHLGVRGHVMRDGVPIYKSIAPLLQRSGFRTSVNSEGMVLARREAILAQQDIHPSRRAA